MLNLCQIYTKCDNGLCFQTGGPRTSLPCTFAQRTLLHPSPTPPPLPDLPPYLELPPRLPGRRQTEGDIFAPHHLEQRKLSEPASPIQILVSGPEEEVHPHLHPHLHLHPLHPHTNPAHLFSGYRVRRSSDSVSGPSTPGASSPGSPGSPESDLPSSPASPRSTEILPILLTDLVPTMMANTEVTDAMVADMVACSMAEQAQATYHLMAPVAAASPPAHDTAISQIQEFEVEFNRYQAQGRVQHF